MDTSIEQFGVEYVFGFNGLTPPAIGGGLVLTKLKLDKEPEIFVTGTNGGGRVAAIAKTTPNLDKIDFDGTGYITDLSDFDAVADYFNWNGRTYFIKKKSEPFEEAGFLMVGITGESYAGVSAP